MFLATFPSKRFASITPKRESGIHFQTSDPRLLEIRFAASIRFYGKDGGGTRRLVACSKL